MTATVSFDQVLRNHQVANYFRYDFTSSRALFRYYNLSLRRYPINRRCWILDKRIGLVTDVAWIGNPQAQNVLVVISGTHGVEGYCGSAIQSFLMHALEQQWLDLTSDHAVLFIHALNPWGMYWARRCDQSGVDLNRNFINFESIPDVDPRYEKVLASLELDSCLARQQVFSELKQEWGDRILEQVFSGGQYHCPWAPFFGGFEPSFASRVIDEVIEYWQLQKLTLVVIDLHSGLGPWGYGEIISDHPVDSCGSKYAYALFKDSIAETAKGESSSVPKSGLMDYRWHQLMHKKGCFVTLEFGTRSTSDLFAVLTDEHLFWWRHSDVIDMQNESYKMHRNAMLNHFCPQDSIWQQAVLFRSWQLVQQTLSRWK